MFGLRVVGSEGDIFCRGDEEYWRGVAGKN